MDWHFDVARRTLWMEARNQGPAGWSACAHVLVNRTGDGRWGRTLGEVCLAAEQFSCWNTHDPNRRAMAALADEDALLEQIGDALDAALTGDAPDPTWGATHYCRFDLDPLPAWTEGATFTAKIGAHNFYRGVP